VPDPGVPTYGAQALAGKPLQAVGIRDALTVRAIAREDALVEHAPEWRLTVLAPLTAALVRHPPLALLEREHRDDIIRTSRARLPVRRHGKDHHQRHGEEQPEQNA
jgi:hypothetical protein